MLASGEQARLPAPGSCDLCPSISSQAKIKGLDFSVADVGMTAPGLSAGWEAGGGVASFPGRDAEPTCGQGDLPPWGGPALPSGKGLKPQESGGRQQGRDPSWCFRGGVGGGPQGVRIVSPPPGHGGQPGGPPSPPSCHTGEGRSQMLPRALQPPGHQPGPDPRPRGRLRPRPLQADPGHTCLSPAEKGCAGHAQVSARGASACPQHSRPLGPGFLLGHRPMHDQVGETPGPGGGAV